MQVLHGRAARLLPLAALLSLPIASSAMGRDLFRTALTVDGITLGKTSNDAIEVWHLLEREPIGAGIPFYTEQSAVALRVDLRGMPATLSSPRNGTDLVLRVGRDGHITRVFTGATRQEANDHFQRFLRGEEDPGGMRSIMKEWVATSVVDPVAGNPSSLLGRTVAADLDMAARPPGDDGGMTPRTAGWHGAAELTSDTLSAHGFDTQGYNLPLALSYAFTEDGPEAILRLPLTMTETSGATALYLGLQAGLRLPVVTTPDLRWAVTPSLRVTAGGSERVGGGGQAFGGSLGSDLRLALGGFTLGIGNSIGNTQIEPLKVKEIELPYHVRAWGFRNSLSLSHPVGQVADLPLSMGLSVTDTRIAGDRMAVPSWQEYGVTAVLGQQAPVRLGLSYLDGENGYRGMRFSLSASF